MISADAALRTHLQAPIEPHWSSLRIRGSIGPSPTKQLKNIDAATREQDCDEVWHGEMAKWHNQSDSLRIELGSAALPGAEPAELAEGLRESPYFDIIRTRFFTAHENMKGVITVAADSWKHAVPIMIVRVLCLAPAMVYLLGVLFYFYSGLPANCFIGLQRINNYTGSRDDWSWSDGTPYVQDDFAWASEQSGRETTAKVAGVMSRAYGEDFGVHDFGRLDLNGQYNYPGQPFRPMCTLPGHQFYVLSNATFVLDAKSQAGLAEIAIEAARPRGLPPSRRPVGVSAWGGQLLKIAGNLLEQ
jgi:hypothetical protein